MVNYANVEKLVQKISPKFQKNIQKVSNGKKFSTLMKIALLFLVKINHSHLFLNVLILNIFFFVSMNNSTNMNLAMKVVKILNLLL